MGGTNNLQRLLAVLAALIVVALALWVWRRPRTETPEQLARMALEGDDVARQEHAAVRLEALVGRLPGTSTRNAGRPFLAQVFTESRHPGVRSAAVRGLASIWDYEFLPAMLDLLDDDSAQLRGAAAIAVESLLSAEHRFNAADPPAQRQAVAAQLRQMWKTFAETRLPRWQQQLEQNDMKP